MGLDWNIDWIKHNFWIIECIKIFCVIDVVLSKSSFDPVQLLGVLSYVYFYTWIILLVSKYDKYKRLSSNTSFFLKSNVIKLEYSNHKVLENHYLK